jgi:glycosyltransferase involved in cell wall biosynthesis
MMTEKQSNKKVFVFLGYGFGADSWQQRFLKHQIPGLNEKLPYGYYHAAGDGWEVEYSQDAEENGFRRLWRRFLGRLLGFDLIHAWRNRRQFQASDVVWTHTERESLALLLLLNVLRSKRRPRIVAQCMWLADRWPHFSPARRAVYRKLLQQADVVTTQSPAMLSTLSELLPSVPLECIFSGACADKMIAPKKTQAHTPIRIASVGSDMHRDWITLMRAFGGISGFEIRIASGKLRRSPYSNITIAKATSEKEIRLLYDWADLVVVPLKHNLHISGSTAIFEATVSGKPVVATDTGGLRAYFSDHEISYAPIGDPTALRVAVQRLAKDTDGAFAMVSAAQKRLVNENLTTQGCAQRHRQLSESLLRKERLSATEGKVKVFVHLGYGFGATSWKRRYSRGLIPGLNEPLPYGYFRAADDRWLIEYSEDKQESRLTQLFRRGLQWSMGFDLLHAWRNRGQMRDADVVWTHTEREHLAVLLLWRISKNHKRPRIIAQCIWLFDRWPRLPRWKQRLYLVLLNQADIVTTLSTKNLESARMLLPTKKCESLLFGVDSGVPRMVAREEINKPIKLLALGNDMHRDWKTLLGAFGDLPDYDVRLASNSVPHSLIKGVANVCLCLADTEDELMAMYKWADVVVVPLRDNLHASGITVVLEATLFGLPVICSDTGGMRTYFSDGEIRYVPVADPAAMRSAVDEIAANDNFRRKLISKAQERIRSLDLTAQGFVDRHRKLSEKILFDAADQSAFPARVA